MISWNGAKQLFSTSRWHWAECLLREKRVLCSSVQSGTESTGAVQYDVSYDQTKACFQGRLWTTPGNSGQLWVTLDNYRRLRMTRNDSERLQLRTTLHDSRWLRTTLDDSRRLWTTPTPTSEQYSESDRSRGCAPASISLGTVNSFFG